MSDSTPLTNLFSDPKKLASFVGAGIATLLGLPVLMKFIDPAMKELIRELYPNWGDVVHFLVNGGIYILVFSLLQSFLYVAIGAAVVSLASFSMRFAPGLVH